MEFISRRVLAPIVAALMLLQCGCGRTVPDATTLLKQAKATIDGASSLHFTLSSENVRGSGLLLTGGDGDAKRPDSFSGTLAVSTGGVPISIPIVSVGGKFYAQLPLQTRYSIASPAQYGFGDPAQLLDPNNGLSSLLTDARNPKVGDSTRRNGEELQEVSAALPGPRVSALLVSADPSRDVQAVFRINLDTNQTRQVDLIGPFFAKDRDSTFHLVLDKYGENVSITAPPTA